MKDEIIVMINCISSEAVLTFLHSFIKVVTEDEAAFAGSLAIVTREADEHING